VKQLRKKARSLSMLENPKPESRHCHFPALLLEAYLNGYHQPPLLHGYSILNHHWMFVTIGCMQPISGRASYGREERFESGQQRERGQRLIPFTVTMLGTSIHA